MFYHLVISNQHLQMSINKLKFPFVCEESVLVVTLAGFCQNRSQDEIRSDGKSLKPNQFHFYNQSQNMKILSLLSYRSNIVIFA